MTTGHVRSDRRKRHPPRAARIARRTPLLGLSHLLIFLSLTAALQAAPQEETLRPRVGLALSGGGARGMAHIGVLQWLEDYQIPVDYIAGTSMGGLVGGMYAAGATPQELVDLVRTTDWAAILRGSPPYPELSFRRKEDRRSFTASPEFGLRNGIRIPRGLNEGHAIGLVLDRMTLDYDALTSFDDLPIPFRALATDLVTGELAVLHRGSLSDALRATMAIPGIFTPVISEDAIYADGGLLNNIPTDVVRDMGPEIVIAVNVGSPLLARDALDGLLNILNQSVLIMGIESARRNLEMADIVVAPELMARSLMDFSNADLVIAAGVAGAEAQSEALAALALDDDAWARHLAERLGRRPEPAPMSRSVEVVGTNESAAGGIGERLVGHLGRPIAISELERDLTRIVGEGRFATLGYGASRDERLIVDVLEWTHGPPFVRTGLEVDAATEGNLDLSVGARLTAMEVGVARGEWRADLRYGSSDALETEYFLPIRNSRWFLALRAGWRSSTDGLFQERNRIAQLQTRERDVGLDVGFSLNANNEIRTGYEIRHAAVSILTGDPLFASQEGNFHSAFVRWVRDGYDEPVIPTDGTRVRFETRWFSEKPGLVADAIRTELELGTARAVSSRGSVFVRFNVGRTFRRPALPYQEFKLGGPLRLSAWNPGEFRDGRFELGSIGYLHDIGPPPLPFLDGLYAAAAWEAGRLYRSPNPSNLINALTLAFGTRSPLGAVWVGGSWGEGGEGKAFIRVGRLF